MSKDFFSTLPLDEQSPPSPWDFENRPMSESLERLGRIIDPLGRQREREELAERVRNRNYVPLSGAMYPSGPIKRNGKKGTKPIPRPRAVSKGKKPSIIAPEGYQPPGYPKGIIDDGTFVHCFAQDGGCNLKPCLMEEMKSDLTCLASRHLMDGMNLLATYNRLKETVYRRHCQLFMNRFMKKNIDNNLPQCCVRQCKIAVEMCRNDRPKWLLNKGPTIEDIKAMDLPSSTANSSSSSEESSSDESKEDGPVVVQEIRYKKAMKVDRNLHKGLSQMPDSSQESECVSVTVMQVHTTTNVATRPNRVSLDSVKLPGKRTHNDFASSDESSSDEEPTVAYKKSEGYESDSSDDSFFTRDTTPLHKRRRLAKGFRILEECLQMSQSRYLASMKSKTGRKKEPTARRDNASCDHFSEESEFEF